VLADVARQAIEALGATMSQRELEVTLGLSAAYLSKVRHGEEAPSAPLVALLSLLAARPDRIEEVERVWETRRLSPRVVSTNVSRVDLKVDSDVAVAGLWPSWERLDPSGCPWKGDPLAFPCGR
jgi:transcriptional regulator with XRE-family HTH domain